MKLNVIEHLTNLKNMNIKFFLGVLDLIELPIEDKNKLRESFLDSFNGYHRETVKIFNKLFTDES